MAFISNLRNLSSFSSSYELNSTAEPRSRKTHNRPASPIASRSVRDSVRSIQEPKHFSMADNSESIHSPVSRHRAISAEKRETPSPTWNGARFKWSICNYLAGIVLQRCFQLPGWCNSRDRGGKFNERSDRELARARSESKQTGPVEEIPFGRKIRKNRIYLAPCETSGTDVDQLLPRTSHKR